METAQGLYIFTVKQVHMSHTALLWQRSEFRKSEQRCLVAASADTVQWPDADDRLSQPSR